MKKFGADFKKLKNLDKYLSGDDEIDDEKLFDENKRYRLTDYLTTKLTLMQRDSEVIPTLTEDDFGEKYQELS